MRDDPADGLPLAGAVETAIDALEDGDRPIRPGTARAALRYPVFRRVFIGAFLSNIGSWMQNVILGAMAYDLTHSATFVGVILFAQLGPLLLFSMVGDVIDRRHLLIWVSVVQGTLSVLLAWVARGDDPSRLWLVAITFGIGMGQAVFGPTYSALLPVLVSREDLNGAISLNSAQMNGSRVVGPAIAGLMEAKLGASTVFLVNAASYLLVIWALYTVALPPPIASDGEGSGLRKLLSGIAAAREDPVVGRSLVLVFTFSLLSLPFIGQLPTLADRNLGIDATSIQYGLLYTCFGAGAMLGALSIGTIWADRSMIRIVRVSMVAFAAFLGVFAWVGSIGPAYAVIVLVGFAYFAIITSLSTVLQERLDDHNRGRVMALWIMGFGGTVPIGNLIAGPVIEKTSVTVVVFAGAVIALALAALADLEGPAPPPPGDEVSRRAGGRRGARGRRRGSP
jgi:MFS family permease